ncbi:THP3-like protein C2A9.11c [Auxenochlorella protothecoides]|uniref:THP3-like protein C2A9.11c n=1 Tax=Auxenochlorella protothecoides TaxID=3075 RepID=A0A087SBI9_AUXPR|nr:THP3-like protein C2A9.11c [Auxenochlorella protothecoides]KFM23093.1 THP3-like protein C2A9.11c [Auxenochlorella protothecoides]
MGPGDGSLDLRTPGTPRMRMGTTRATSTPGTTTNSHITTAQTRHTESYNAAYVERAFTATPAKARPRLQLALKSIIAEAQAQGELWRRDWDTLPLPDMQHSAEDAAVLVRETAAFAPQPNVGHERRQRFLASLDRANTQEELDWDAFAVKGTCTRLEKSYFRLTSAPDPATVRSEPVLRAALDQLVARIASGQAAYFYALDQFKGLRQDCTVQHLRNGLARQVYEAHARAALEYGDVAEYNQCQGQLAMLDAADAAAAYVGEHEAQDEERGLASCLAWLEECGAVTGVDVEGAVFLDCKASSGRLARPADKEAVAHGDANLDIGDFMKGMGM